MTAPTELKTTRLLLRPLRLSDVDDVLEYASDPQWVASYERPYDRGTAEHLVARAVLALWNQNAKFAIVFEDRVMGLVDLTVDPERQTAELGFEVAKPLWQQGLAVEAAAAVCEWGFRAYGLVRIDARARSRNMYSRRVMQDLGMTYEGTHRSADVQRSERADEVSYAVLREEWRGLGGPLPSISKPAPRRFDTTYRAEHPQLTTPRLTLRPFGPGDVDDVFKYAGDPEWAEYLLDAIPQPYTRRNAEEYIAGRMVASGREFVWAMVHDSAVIGGIGLKIDLKHETSEIGYALSRSHWGRGLMTEGGRVVLDWGFGEQGLRKVTSHADIRNQRSWRVMERLGMMREGVLRSHRRDPRPGYPRIDVVLYSVLRQEWEQTADVRPVVGEEDSSGK